MSQFVLPQLLQALRKHAKLSQSELAQKLGITPSAVHQAENAAHPVKEELFARYAAAFGYTSELEALEQGVALVRFDERMASKVNEIEARRKAPKKRAAPAKAPRKRASRASTVAT